MADTLTFTGVVLKSFSRNKKGGKAIFHANLTKSVGEAMGWGGMTEGQTAVNLEGSLAASSVVLQPKDGPLAKCTVQFSASAVNGFQALRLELEGKKGKGHRFELRFTVEFADVTACRYLEEFITHAGDAKSTLTVSYTKQAKQMALGDNGPELDEQRQLATAAEAD